jgi:hypothetical protein
MIKQVQSIHHHSPQSSIIPVKTPIVDLNPPWFIDSRPSNQLHYSEELGEIHNCYCHSIDVVLWYIYIYIYIYIYVISFKMYQQRVVKLGFPWKFLTK